MGSAGDGAHRADRRPGRDSDEELTAHLNEELARYKHPRRLIRADGIPRTPAGKLNRTLARELATSIEEEQQ